VASTTGRAGSSGCGSEGSETSMTWTPLYQTLHRHTCRRRPRHRPSDCTVRCSSRRRDGETRRSRCNQLSPWHKTAGAEHDERKCTASPSRARSGLKSGKRQRAFGRNVCAQRAVPAAMSAPPCEAHAPGPAAGRPVRPRWGNRAESLVTRSESLDLSRQQGNSTTSGQPPPSGLGVTAGRPSPCVEPSRPPVRTAALVGFSAPVRVGHNECIEGRTLRWRARGSRGVRCGTVVGLRNGERVGMADGGRLLTKVE